MAVRGASAWTRAGPGLRGPARRPRLALPPFARPVRQSRPGRRRGSPPRPNRPRIFPLVRRPGSTRQLASIGRARETPICHWATGMSVPADNRPPGRAAKARHLRVPLPRRLGRLSRTSTELSARSEGLPAPPPQTPAGFRLSPSPSSQVVFTSTCGTPGAAPCLRLSTSNCISHTTRGKEFCRQPGLQMKD